MGSYALALTRHFGSVGLEQTKAPDSVYFNLTRFLVHYPQAWSIPLAIFAVLLGAGVIAVGLRRGHVRPGGLGLGFVVLPVAMAAAALVAHLTWTVILALHPGGVWALEYRPAIIWLGMASLTVAVTATLYAALRNRIGAFDLAVGGLLWWLLLAAATSVAFPPASYLFTWPLVFSLLGLGILFAVEARPTPGWRRFTVLMITGIPAAFLAASGVYGITMTRELLLPYVVPMFAAAIVLMLGLLIPHLDLIARAGRWVLAVGTAALALGLLLAGSLSAGFDARHPQPDTHHVRAQHRHRAGDLGQCRREAGRLDRAVPWSQAPQELGGATISATTSRNSTLPHLRSHWRPRAYGSSTPATAVVHGPSRCT